MYIQTARNISLNSDVPAQLERIFVDENPLFKEFQKRYEKADKTARQELKENTANEIAGIIVRGSSPTADYPVVCYKTTANQSAFVNELSALYMPLQFVLIFPDGSAA